MNASYCVFTYPTRITFTDEGLDILLRLGQYFATARNHDYAAMVDAYRRGDKQSTKHERRTRLAHDFCMSKREADNIVYCNSEQFSLAQRTTTDNIREWEKERKSLHKTIALATGIKKKNALDKIAILDSKINKAQRKSPSCCFGGSKLQKRITQNYSDDKLKEDWDNKRLFLQFMGETGISCGNDTIRLKPQTGELTLRISSALCKAMGLHATTFILGHVSIRNGSAVISHAVENNLATSYQFVWDTRKRVWRLHITARVDKTYLRSLYGFHAIKGRVCGIDQNSGFISCTIIDAQGNPIARRDFRHCHSRDMSMLVNTVYRWMRHWKCDSVAVENLRGLSSKKRSSVSSAKALNRVVNKIPYGEFSTLLHRKMEVCGGKYVKVSPYRTSRDTVYWTQDKYGISTHQKASYLIARRGLGYDIRPRYIRTSPQSNSVCSGVSSPNNGTGLISSSHDSRVSFHSVCSDY